MMQKVGGRRAAVLVGAVLLVGAQSVWSSYESGGDKPASEKTTAQMIELGNACEGGAGKA